MMSSMLANALFAPQMAVPASVIYKERPALMQVNPKDFARELLTKKQFSCFTKLVGKESAWKSTAKNPKSSAKGIGQLLDSTYRNLGMKHSEAAVVQTIATLAYIGRRYGNGGPCAAWAHWKHQKAKTGSGWY
jgi:hypothetical protein